MLFTIFILFLIKINFFQSSKYKTVDHSVNEESTTINEINQFNNYNKNNQQQQQQQLYGMIRNISPNNNNINSSSLEQYYYYQNKSDPLQQHNPEKTYNMTKTVKKLVDTLELDLAKQMKRRPSGQFDSCKWFK